MAWQVIKIKVLQWARRIVLYGAYLILVFFFLGFGLLQIPAVQRALVSRITDRFSGVSGFHIEYDSFYLLWYDRLEITGLKIVDPQQNTLIEAGRLYVNFTLATVYQRKNINIDAVELQEGTVNLVTIPYEGKLELNIDVFIAEIGKQLSSGKPKTEGASGAKLNIGEVLIEQSQFSLHQSDADSLARGFDPNHFRLLVDDGNLNDFEVIGDTIQFNLTSLRVKETKTNLDISSLRTYFRISQKSMEFLGIDLNCNQSHVSDTVILTYNSQRDLSDFVNLVNLDVRLKDTRLHPEDIAHFARGLDTWKKTVTLNGHFRGKISRFSFKPMEVNVGSTTIAGSLEMDGLPSIAETFINVKLKPSVAYGSDLAFLFPENINNVLIPLGRIQLNGNFLGFTNDFVADGEFLTKLGRISSDINYKISADNLRLSAYRGNLALTDFHLGQFFQDTVNFQEVTLRGNINGKGFTKESADFVLNGEISSFGIRGYDYQNIRSNARFANQFFNGSIDIDDPNLQFSMEGSIDLRENKDLIKVKARLDTARLRPINLSTQHIFIRSDLEIDSRGLEIDSIVGTVLFKNAFFQFADESIKLDSIHLISEKHKDGRALTLRSSVADGALTGNFYYSTMFNDIQRLVQEFMLNLRNDPAAIQAYYSKKPAAEQRYKAAINVMIHDANPLLDIFDLNLYVSPETAITGEFSNSTTSRLHVLSRIDSVAIGSTGFLDNEIEFNGSKIRDSTQVLAQLTITSEQQQLSKNLTTKNLFMEGIWNLDHIDFRLDADQAGYDNRARLNAEIDFLEDSTRLKLLPSVIRILGDDWETNRNNFVLMKGKEWRVHQVGLSHAQQSILVDGEISRDSTRALTIDIKDLNLSLLNSFSRENFGGLLNAKIIQKDMYDDLFIENNLTIDSLTVNRFLVGEVRGNNMLDPATGLFNIDLKVDRLENRIVNIEGYYNPDDKISPLHAKAILAKANVKLIEPVVRDLFSQLDGTLSGEYDIRGTFAQPSISGEAKLENGQLMINYLKTLYNVTGTIGMTPTEIQFKTFTLTDVFKNTGRLEGKITHREFRRMAVDLNATFANFQVLNTNIKDNDLFYGQAFGTGTLNISGPVNNLRISATAQTNRNTRLSLPLGGGTSSQEKKEFIQFVSFTQETKTKKRAAAPKKRELSGITLDLNVDVTPDAYAEIIFDIKSGDIIRGRGRGDLRLQVDTKGEFNMFGRVDFTEGAYNFTLYDVINKEFQIKPGSNIAWYGDPYEAQMNITASYRQTTSMAPILQDQSVVSDPVIRRKYPVEVLLKLEGLMMTPQLNFDLSARDLPDNVLTADGKSVRLKFEFDAFKSKLDEQELKLQVFSLIVLRKLSPPNAFVTSASGSTLYNSVSELLSNQLSYWLSQVDENLEIDLDLGTLDAEAFNTFQLRLSYSFLGGRLRVSKDGTYGGNQPNRSELATIAGDWTVDYLLTPDGKFKVKMYSRSNVNQIQSSLNTQTAPVTTGTSLLYTENFNTFSELLMSARERRRRELEKNPELADDNEEPKGN
ncbi:MAG: translocation/assembly module TamB [Cyclobacteriaceae bacterium]|nr:translocation/assembly module TamB [Cyclobacteriaceae bacterium]